MNFKEELQKKNGGSRAHHDEIAAGSERARSNCNGCNAL